MSKYLYFATGGGANATGEAAMYPVESLRGCDPISATTMALWFTPAVIGDAVAAGDLNDKVLLTITSGAHKTVLSDIVAGINAHPNGDPFIVVCDADNSVFVGSSISGCAITLAG